MPDNEGWNVMAVYVVEIDGRGIAAFHAANEADVEQLLRDQAFRDDLARERRAAPPARGRRFSFSRILFHEMALPALPGGATRPTLAGFLFHEFVFTKRRCRRCRRRHAARRTH